MQQAGVIALPNQVRKITVPSLLVGLFLIAGLATPVQAAPALPAACAASIEAPVCFFACGPFLYVNVVSLGGDGTISGSCGGASASCQGHDSPCTAVSSTPSQGVSVGTCSWTVGPGADIGFGFCYAGAGSG